MRTYEKTTRIPDTNEPVKKPRPSALRYPLPSEIAEGELLQSGVDTLQTRADLDRNEHGRSKALSFAMRKRAPEMSQPVKKARPSVRTSYPIQKTNSTGVEKVQSVVDTFQAKANLDRNERIRSKALSLAMRKRVAEMAHCQDVLEGFQERSHARKRDHKRHRNKRISWTWTDHFLLHHSVWLSNQSHRVRNKGVEACNKMRSKRCNMFNSAGKEGHDTFAGGCTECRADGAVYIPDGNTLPNNTYHNP